MSFEAEPVTVTVTLLLDTYFHVEEMINAPIIKPRAKIIARGV